MSKRLNIEQRKLLEQHHAAGWSQRDIGLALGVSGSTVNRELLRNRAGGEYHAEAAQRLTRSRRVGVGPPRVAEESWQAAQDQLGERWSPEQIAGDAPPERAISAATIRRRIAEDRRAGGQLYRCLRQRGKQRLSRQQRQAQRCNNIPQRVHYSQRPLAAHARAEFGHWEMDTILDPGTCHRAGALILVDRATRLLRLFPLPRISARACADAAVQLLRGLPAHSITADNGGEFAQHRRITDALGTPVFFSDPGCPQQRGSCENAVALVRDLTRDLALASLSPSQLQAIADRINHRPMKLLGWHSRHQAARMV